MGGPCSFFLFGTISITSGWLFLSLPELGEADILGGHDVFHTEIKVVHSGNVVARLGRFVVESLVVRRAKTTRRTTNRRHAAALIWQLRVSFARRELEELWISLQGIHLPMEGVVFKRRRNVTVAILPEARGVFSQQALGILEIDSTSVDLHGAEVLVKVEHNRRVAQLESPVVAIRALDFDRKLVLGIAIALDGHGEVFGREHFIVQEEDFRVELENPASNLESRGFHIRVEIMNLGTDVQVCE